MAEYVTVIVPIYKTEKYLRRCVDSIINQTYRDLEIILVDDGSPDKSGQICDEYALLDSRIKVVHKKNGGISDARNFGINISTGKYVMFCDSDDWIEPDTIQIAINEIDSSQAELVVWGYAADFVNSEDILIDRSICIANEKIFTGHADCLNNIQVFGLLGYPWNKLYRRSILHNQKIIFEEEVSLLEDVLFNAQVINHCNLISIIDFIGTHYVQRNRVTLGSMVDYNFMKWIFYSIEAKKNILLHFETNIELTKKIISNHIITAFKAGILNIADNSSLSYRDKIVLLHILLRDKYFISLIGQCEPKTVKDFFFVLLLRLKATNLLFHFCKH